DSPPARVGRGRRRRGVRRRAAAARGRAPALAGAGPVSDHTLTWERHHRLRVAPSVEMRQVAAITVTVDGATTTFTGGAAALADVERRARSVPGAVVRACVVMRVDDAAE